MHFFSSRKKKINNKNIQLILNKADKLKIQILIIYMIIMNQIDYMTKVG